MLNQVSWSTYLKLTSLLLIIYYLFIGIKFYSKELLSFLPNRRHLTGNRRFNGHERNQSEEAPVEESGASELQSHKKNTESGHQIDDTFHEVEKLASALKD